MSMKGKRVLLGLVCLVLSVLTGCGEKPGQPAGGPSVQEEGMQIGITFDSFVIERWQRDRDVFVSTAQELGAEVNVQNANGDLQEQIAQIDYFIKKKVDVIVIVMVASEEDTGNFLAAVERAQRAGIPVIAYDRLILNADVDLYISFDNVQVGRLMESICGNIWAETGRSFRSADLWRITMCLRSWMDFPRCWKARIWRSR